jgi:hypothetical protein
VVVTTALRRCAVDRTTAVLVVDVTEEAGTSVGSTLSSVGITVARSGMLSAAVPSAVLVAGRRIGSLMPLAIA